MFYPQPTDFINIHSHYKSKAGEWVLRNAFHCLLPQQILNLSYAVSVGVHPWMVEKVNWDSYYFLLYEKLKTANVMAIGEIGLDRAAKSSFELQVKFFESQLAFAERFRKPVIIHAVKTYTDFIPYLKSSSAPFIFHHFTGNEFELNQLMKYKTYFSFGKSLINPSEKSKTVFNSVPVNRLFLETDTMNMSVEAVYHQASILNNMNIAELKENVFHNFAAVFKNDHQLR